MFAKDRRYRGSRRLPLVSAALLLLTFSAAAHAQLTGVELLVGPQDVGFGISRHGGWVPARLRLRNRSAEVRTVICRWVLRDLDGDELLAERTVDLNPATGTDRPTTLWLYAAPPLRAASRRPYTFKVIDAKTEAELASTEFHPDPVGQTHTATGVIGIMGTRRMGLDRYADKPYTQHEQLRLVSGLVLPDLPDRWYGLAQFSSLIWTPQGGDPDDALIRANPAIADGLREWVRRGGHLVVIMPQVGETWTTSLFAPMLPAGPEQVRAIQAEPPRAIVGESLRGTPEPMRMRVFSVDPERDGVSVIRRSSDGEPMIIGRRYGFGQVTMVGVDLSATPLQRMGLPTGRYRVWNDIFGWRTPVYARAAIQGMLRQQSEPMTEPNQRRAVELARFVNFEVDMREKAAPALLLAIVVFGAYWVLAGPTVFFALKGRSMHHHSWVAFVGVVVVFTVVSWAGAWLMQPATAQVRHVTVLDIDGNLDRAKARAWITAYVPRFGRVKVQVDPAKPDAMNTIIAPGLPGSENAASFPDQQSYAVDVGLPNHIAYPSRATAKQMTVEFLGELGDPRPGLSEKWVGPQGDVSLGSDSFPKGVLQHGLPGTLENVFIVYCPGKQGRDRRDHNMPWIWRVGEWPAMTPLHLEARKKITRADYQPMVLVSDPPLGKFVAGRTWQNEGYLGVLMKARPGSGGGGHDAINLAEDEKVKQMLMLSFFDMLPPPDFLGEPGMMSSHRPLMYQRSLGRRLDLTPLTTGRRVMIIGFLRDSSLPVPLTIDGDTVESHGWTVVRWIRDF